jgi:hypothetical protein
MAISVYSKTRALPSGRGSLKKHNTASFQARLAKTGKKKRRRSLHGPSA